MAIATGTALLAGATLASGALSASAAGKAAKTQAKSADQAAQLQNQQFQQTREDMAPWRAAGGQAIGQLSGMLQPGYDHTTSPGYQFRLSEGMRGVEGSAAARGLLHSGGTLKGIMRYGQGIAADDFNDQFNRTASVAAGGQQVNTTLGQLGANMAGNVGNMMMQGANSRASGYVGQANAFNGTLNNLFSLYNNQGGGFGGTTNAYGIQGGNIY